jgi:hypothetical protein
MSRKLIVSLTGTWAFSGKERREKKGLND